MSDNSLLWRFVLVVFLVGVAAFSVYPPTESINLGLDLRGGMHLVLQVEREDALSAETDKEMERLRQEAEAKGLAGMSTLRTGETSFDVTGVSIDQESTLGEVADEYLVSWTWGRSGDRYTFEMRAETVAYLREEAVRQALQTIRNRVDAFGVAEPVIQRQGLGSDRIVVQLPGVDDPERVKKLIKNTAFLEFRLVDYPPGGGGVDSREAILSQYGGRLPENVEILSGVRQDATGQVVGNQYYAVEKRRVITGRDLKTARPGLGQFSQPVVNFSLTHDGAGIFAETTGNNIGRGLAIILDGKVVSAPRINGRIAGEGLIEGSFTQQEVEDLSMTLRTGALPARITYLEERTVGPTLGQDSIDQGQRAFLGGFLLVIVTMLVVYHRTGLNALLALVLNIVLVFGALAYFGATLTLPGIAGIVLTIGMAVDANVLVFERIREELRAGRTVKSAVSSGFEKALSSVFDANITTLIAALFLFNFGTGPIRGFAVTLSIGIVASVFTAIFVSRLIFDSILSRQQKVEKLSI